MSLLTARVALELLSHEAIVREAYQDSVGGWTWGVGVTEASGHAVCPRYVDKPQTLRWCLEMYVRLLRETYAPAVLEAFAGHALLEHQFGAALSFILMYATFFALALRTVFARGSSAMEAG